MSRRKVGGDYGWIGPVAIGLVVIGAGYMLIKKLGSSLSTGSGVNNQGTTSANTSAANASTAQASAAGINPTLTPNQMAQIANNVYSLGVNAQDSTDLDSINSQLDQVNNIADLNGIISAFGTKQIPSGNVTAWYNTCLSLGIDCTSVGLGAFVLAVYTAYDPSGTYLSTLNSFLTDQGINYQF